MKHVKATIFCDQKLLKRLIKYFISESEYGCNITNVRKETEIYSVRKVLYYWVRISFIFPMVIYEMY